MSPIVKGTDDGPGDKVNKDFISVLTQAVGELLSQVPK